jgi:GntR family transcriptional repressor for pyruvate dehydrogenase complex
MASDPERVFTPLRRRGATAEAITAIQEHIQSGRYAPGDRLPSERELSEALGVSRPTVREAVQSLAAMNILEVKHGSGIYVASLEIAELLTPMRFALELTAPTLDHLFEIRTQLEPLAAELAAIRGTDEEFDHIRECLAKLSVRGITRDQRLEYDIDLHRSIVVSSHNDLLVILTSSLSMLARRSRDLTIDIPGVSRRAKTEHRAIVDAIVSRRPSDARALMAAHLDNVHQAVERHRSRRLSSRV